jgi:hypothetical protein
VGKPEGKRTLERHTCRWVVNVKIDLKRGRMVRAWTGLIWLRTGTNEGFVNVGMKFRFHIMPGIS